jgi:hypothetical protein
VPVHGWRLYTGAAHLRLDEEPIESRVVGDESVVAESVGEIAYEVLKTRRVTNIHAPNPMDALRPEVAPGVHECRPGFSPTVGLDGNDGDLDDAMVVAGCSPVVSTSTTAMGLVRSRPFGPPVDRGWTFSALRLRQKLTNREH